MSDESQPPQLRLRPRKRDGEPAPAANPPVPAAAPAAEAPPPVATPPPALAAPLPVPTPLPAAPAEALPRFRLKPKLVSDTDGKTADISPLPVIPVPVVEFSPSPPPEDPSGIPRLRLRMVEPGSADPVMPLPMPAPDIPAVGMSPPAFVPLPPVPTGLPLPEPASIPQLVGGLPPVVVKPAAPLVPRPVSALPPLPALPPPLAKFAPKSPRKKRVMLVSLLTALPVILGAVAYFIFMHGQTPVPVVANHAPVPTSKPPAMVDPAATPSPARLSPASNTLLGQPLTGSQIPPLPAPPLPPPPASVSASRSAAQHGAGAASSAASAAFRAWIDGVRITGVVSGASPRAIINGRLVRPGDVVDASAGIIFDSLDLERKQVIFSNRTGMFAGKSY